MTWLPQLFYVMYAVLYPGRSIEVQGRLVKQSKRLEVDAVVDVPGVK